MRTPLLHDWEDGKPAVWVLLDVTPVTPEYEEDLAFRLECIGATMEIALRYFVDYLIGEELFQKLIWRASPHNMGYWKAWEEDGPRRYFLLRQEILQEDIIEKHRVECKRLIEQVMQEARAEDLPHNEEHA